MRGNFKEQFENLGQIILTNVSTLKALIKQSEHLENTINSLNNEDKKEIKDELLNTKKEIAASIEILVVQTKKLFEAYDKLIDKIFGK